jgi:hypothetical protein
MQADFCFSPQGLGLKALKTSQGRLGGFSPPGQNTSTFSCERKTRK